MVGGFVIGLLALLGLGGLGFLVRPRPFPPVTAAAAPGDGSDLPDDLPAPVARYLRAALDGRLPAYRTAILTGRIRLRFGPLRVPARFRFYYAAGQGYHHLIEVTWFGFPLGRVEENYNRGRSRFNLLGRISEDDPAINRAANMGLWAEMVWLPGAYADPGIRWEAVSAASARLIFPFGVEEDSLLFTFDPETGLPTESFGMRQREAGALFTGWRNVVRRWGTLNGVQVPLEAATIWEDQGYPWAVWQVEAVDYGVDVAQWLP